MISSCLNNKLIINLTPTGMIPTREMTQYVPMTPSEISQSVKEAIEYGVSMVHLHARDENGDPTYRKEVYKEIIDRIRDFDEDVILAVSTSGRNWREIDKRAECLELEGFSKPDMASLTLSSLNFNKQASISSPDDIQSLAMRMKERGIKPELEAFDVGMINYAKYLHKKGFIDPPFYMNLILGNIACAQANILNLGVMLSELPEDTYWSVGGVGDCQLRMNVNAMINGGGVRVGLEDNIYMDEDRKFFASNQSLVVRIYKIAECLGLEIAKPSEVREALNLTKQINGREKC